MTLDGSGTMYLLGRSGSDDFPLPLAGHAGQPGLQTGIFLIQVKRDGSLGFARGLPLDESTNPLALTVAGDSVYIAGTAFAGTLATTPGAFQPVPAAGQSDAFVMRLDLATGSVVYSTLLGGTREETLAGLAVDASGRAYVAGSTQSIDFPITAGVLHVVAPATPLRSSVFVSIVDPSGGRLIASSVFGGEATDDPSQLVLAPNGDVWIAGSTSSHLFPVTAGSLRTPNLSANWSFVVRLPADLKFLDYSMYLDRDTSISAVIPQSDRSLVLTGSTGSRTFPLSQNALERCHAALAPTARTGFVMRLNESGHTLLYGSYFNVSRNGSELFSSAIGPDGKLFLIDQSAGYDLSYYGGPIQMASPNDHAANFLVELDPSKSPSASLSCAVDAAGLAAALSSSGELITIFGTAIGPAVAQLAEPGDHGRFPSTLGGTTVLIGGQAAELLYADAGQINAFVPPLQPAADRAALIQVMRDGQLVAAFQVPVFEEAPNLFGTYANGQAAALNEDGSLNAPNHPARSGTRVTLFGTGFGPTVPPQNGSNAAEGSSPLASTPKFFVNSAEAMVWFAGQSPGAAPGLIHFDLTAPAVPAFGSYGIDFLVGSNFQLGMLRIWVTP
jgi:uncharacterized protein (TIGR03437 family)